MFPLKIIKVFFFLLPPLVKFHCIIFIRWKQLSSSKNQRFTLPLRELGAAVKSLQRLESGTTKLCVCLCHKKMTRNRNKQGFYLWIIVLGMKELIYVVHAFQEITFLWRFFFSGKEDQVFLISFLFLVGFSDAKKKEAKQLSSFAAWRITCSTNKGNSIYKAPKKCTQVSRTDNKWLPVKNLVTYELDLIWKRCMLENTIQ